MFPLSDAAERQVDATARPLLASNLTVTLRWSIVLLPLVAAGFGTALALSARAFAAPSSSNFERCCFAVRVDVSGRLVRGEHTASWRWTVSHRSLFVDKGRIFAALTAPPGERLVGSVRFRFREEAGRCTRRVLRTFRSPAAFVSFEDSLTATDSLVARAGLPLAPRCGLPFAGLPAWVGHLRSSCLRPPGRRFAGIA
jgi:hypothetical protein